MDAEGSNVTRRLAAVLAADVVAYSRLMEVDEAGTLARLKAIRLELIDPAITTCKGRIIKTTGDGMLVEFQSVTEALRCAVDFQERMARRNRDMPAARTLLYRIGINLGDVIVEEGDIFGDGVNLAARLEAMAEPGGICISAAVRDQVGDRLSVGYEDLGEQHVKNIARPIRVYKVLLNEKTTQTPANGAAPAHAASPVSARKPSIAVLPFVNMSGDAEQEFFADGLTEDIITELSRFRDLLVISRNAVFVHKGKPVKAQEIAREFGVDYVVEGSVRKAAAAPPGRPVNTPPSMPPTTAPPTAPPTAPWPGGGGGGGPGGGPNCRRQEAEVHIRHRAAAPRLVRSTDLHIRCLRRRRAARPSDDRRNTNSHRPSTNSRIARNDIRRGANARHPKPGVRDHPSGFGREQSEVLCWPILPDRLGRPSGDLIRLWRAGQVRPSGGRVPSEDDFQLPGPLVEPPEPSGLAS